MRSRWPFRRSPRTSRNRSCRPGSAIRRRRRPAGQTNESPARQRCQPATAAVARAAAVEIVDLLEALEELRRSEPVPQVEYPAGARRDPRYAGTLDPVAIGLGYRPWGAASGKALQILMRRMDTPLASRWAHIGLRNALLAKAASPPTSIRPTGRPSGPGCCCGWARPMRRGCWSPASTATVSRRRCARSRCSRRWPTATRRRCARSNRACQGRAAGRAAGHGDLRLAVRGSRSARRPTSKRRGAAGGLSAIDIALADKVVGAGAETARAVTIEWEPVDELNSWRYGLATATGDDAARRLINSVKPADAGLAGAGADVLGDAATADGEDGRGARRIFEPGADRPLCGVVRCDRSRCLGRNRGLAAAAGLSSARTSTRGCRRCGPSGAMRSRRSTGWRRRCCCRGQRDGFAPNADLQSDAPDLVASLLARADSTAKRRAGAGSLGEMDDEPGDAVWAMLALGAPDARARPGSMPAGSRISPTATRAKASSAPRCSSPAWPGLAGSTRATAGQLNRDYRLGLGAETGWTRMIDGAMRRRQAGTVDPADGQRAAGHAISTRSAAVYLYHAVNALRRTGQEYLARMIAAEALART